MDKIITHKIKVLEEMIALSTKRIADSNKSKDSITEAYWFGVRTTLRHSLKMFNEVLDMYENNVKSLEDSMKFLRGEE